MPREIPRVQTKILVVEDWEAQLEGLMNALKPLGYEVDGVRNAEEALQKAQSGEYGVMLLDLEIYKTIEDMKGDSLIAGARTGLDLIPEITRTPAIDMEILVLTRFSDLDSNPLDRESLVKAMESGARGYLPKSLVLQSPQAPNVGVVRPEGRLFLQFQIEPLLALYQQKKARRKGYAFSDVVCSSRYMVRTVEALKSIAEEKTPIVLWGEHGSGKSFLAEAIHFNSQLFRQDPALIKSEADLDRYCSHPDPARGTTLILRYIEDFNLDAQKRLLSLLNNVSGESRFIMICAEEPTALRDTGRLDPALYDLINDRGPCFICEIPALRNPLRQKDIGVLAAHFLKKANEQDVTHVSAISSQAEQVLSSYPWKNITEMRQTIRKAVLHAEDAARTSIQIFPDNDLYEVLADVEMLDPKQRIVLIRGKRLPLNPTAFKVMDLLTKAHPDTAPHDELLNVVKTPRSLISIISQLRNRINQLIEEPKISTFRYGFIQTGGLDPDTGTVRKSYGYMLYPELKNVVPLPPETLESDSC